MHWYDFVPEKDKKRMSEDHKQRSQRKGNPPSEYACGFIDKKGDLKTVHVKLSIMPDSNNRIVSLLDISKRKKAEEE